MLDRMILRPTRDPIDPLSKTRVLLSGPDGVVECFVGRTGEGWDEAFSQMPDLLVVKFPGTGGRAERATAFPGNVLGKVRCEIWTLNPPGYGGSEGKPSLRTIGEVSLECFDQIVESVSQRGPSKVDSTIWLTGNSLGCVTAMRVASDRSEVDALILRNPPPLIDVVKRVARGYPLGRLTDPVAESLPDTMNLLITAPKVNRPAVLIQSLADELVPPSLQQKVIDAYAGEIDLVALDGLSHGGVPNERQQERIAGAVEQLWARM